MKSVKMTFSEIKTQMKERDILFSDIAEALNVTRSHVHTIANNKAKSSRVANAIALCLGKETSQVFGDTYTGCDIGRGQHRKSRQIEVIKAIRANSNIPTSQSFA